jgi:hypothetical protein
VRKPDVTALYAAEFRRQECARGQADDGARARRFRRLSSCLPSLI